MINTILTAALTGAASAFIGVAVNEIMHNEPILNWWFRFGAKIGIKIVDGYERERWFYRPIWGCSKCLSGQIALWYYLFNHSNYSIFVHIFTISTAIITAVFLTKQINK